MYVVPYFVAKRKKGNDTCHSLSLLSEWTRKRRNNEALLYTRDTPDTPLREEQMEVPSSFDESLVRNGRLHWTRRIANVGRERFMRPQELCGT